VSIAAGTCLPSCCPETARYIRQSRGRCTATVLHATELNLLRKDGVRMWNRFVRPRKRTTGGLLWTHNESLGLIKNRNYLHHLTASEEGLYPSIPLRCNSIWIFMTKFLLEWNFTCRGTLRGNGIRRREKLLTLTELELRSSIMQPVTLLTEKLWLIQCNLLLIPRNITLFKKRIAAHLIKTIPFLWKPQ
jgi:hypothetical protein